MAIDDVVGKDVLSTTTADVGRRLFLSYAATGLAAAFAGAAYGQAKQDPKPEDLLTAKQVGEQMKKSVEDLTKEYKMQTLTTRKAFDDFVQGNKYSLLAFGSQRTPAEVTKNKLLVIQNGVIANYFAKDSPLPCAYFLMYKDDTLGIKDPDFFKVSGLSDVPCNTLYSFDSKTLTIIDTALESSLLERTLPTATHEKIFRWINPLVFGKASPQNGGKIFKFAGTTKLHAVSK